MAAAECAVSCGRIGSAPPRLVHSGGPAGRGYRQYTRMDLVTEPV